LDGSAKKPSALSSSQLALPRKRQVCRANDQDPVAEAAQLELPQQEAGHYSLAGARVVCEKETNPRNLQQVVIDGLTRDDATTVYRSTRRWLDQLT
jgi:hypothetical protein